MHFFISYILHLLALVNSIQCFTLEHAYDPKLVSRADTSSSSKGSSMKAADKKRVSQDWTQNKFHLISGPDEKPAVYGGVQSEVPWGAGSARSAEIQGLLDDYAEAKLKFLFDKVPKGKRTDSGMLLIAMLWLESTNKLYMGTIPYGQTREVLHEEFDTDKDLRYNQWTTELHAEHLAVGIARMSGALKSELNGKERRYMAVYGTTDPNYTGPKKWTYPCPHPDQKDANDPTCQTWLKALGISFLGNTDSMKTPEPETSKGSRARPEGSPGSPKGSPVSPPRKKPKARRSLAMEEMLDVILEIRDAEYLSDVVPAWIASSDYGPLLAEDLDIWNDADDREE